MSELTREQVESLLRVCYETDAVALLAHDAALRAKVAAMTQERDRLKEALRFYADPQTYGISGGSVDRIIQDAGKRAVAALRGETAPISLSKESGK